LIFPTLAVCGRFLGLVNGSLYDRLYLVWVKCHIYGCGCASVYTFRCRSSGRPFGLGLRVTVELFVAPILLERVVHVELGKLNRNSVLMYVQATQGYGEGAAGAEPPLGNEGTKNCHSRGTVVAKLPL